MLVFLGCIKQIIAASVKDEIMSAAEESGCLGVVIGMESEIQNIKEIRKPEQLIFL